VAEVPTLFPFLFHWYVLKEPVSSRTEPGSQKLNEPEVVTKGVGLFTTVSDLPEETVQAPETVVKLMFVVPFEIPVTIPVFALTVAIFSSSLDHVPERYRTITTPDPPANPFS
jgi:hypothetical protein